MAAAIHHFDTRDTGVDRGATWSTGIGFDTGLDPSNPIPISPSGAADIVLTIKWRHGSIVKTKATGGITVDDEEGAIFWQLSPEETARMPEGRVASYEIEFRFSSGTQETLVGGKITAYGGLTNG